MGIRLKSPRKHIITHRHNQQIFFLNNFPRKTNNNFGVLYTDTRTHFKIVNSKDFAEGVPPQQLL